MKKKTRETTTDAKGPKAGMRRVVFTLGAPVGANVALAGSFNGWDPAKKPMSDKDGTGVFKATCMLPPGTYEYKFVINGEWSVDPANPNFVVNALNTLNSVIEVS